VARKDMIVMSGEEYRRLELVKKAMVGEVSQVSISKVMGLSERQVRRIIRRVRVEGDIGVVHKLRGKVSNRKFSDKFRLELMGLYHRKYEGFGPTLAVEKFCELDGKVISVETLRKWLILEDSGVYEWRRRGRMHRRWRERKGNCGEMVQMDGSRHDWFGIGREDVLMGYIDDATGRVYARFYDYEGTFPAMDGLRRYMKRYGIPQSIYADRHTTYQSNEKLSIEDELEGKSKGDTQFGRALREIGIELIPAGSPQAKGRIERLFGTLQDRLTKEFRIRGIGNRDEANEFLEREYLDRFNEKFSVVARDCVDLHRKVAKGINLNRILCIKETRALGNDFTVVYNGKLYQIYDRIRAKKLSIQEHIDGSVRIYHKDKRLKYKRIERLSKRQTKPVKKAKATCYLKAGKQWIPPKDHPWRKFRIGYAQR